MAKPRSGDSGLAKSVSPGATGSARARLTLVTCATQQLVRRRVESPRRARSPCAHVKFTTTTPRHNGGFNSECASLAVGAKHIAPANRRASPTNKQCRGLESLPASVCPRFVHSPARLISPATHDSRPPGLPRANSKGAPPDSATSAGPLALRADHTKTSPQKHRRTQNDPCHAERPHNANCCALLRASRNESPFQVPRELVSRDRAPQADSPQRYHDTTEIVCRAGAARIENQDPVDHGFHRSLG